MMQFRLFEDPGQVRRDDPPSSHLAASRVRADSARAKLLLAHRRWPAGLTDEEACVEAGLNLNSEYATRCSELMRLGYLADTPEHRLGASGNARMVRIITQTGIALAEELRGAR